jgi:hypothetical protein
MIAIVIALVFFATVAAWIFNGSSESQKAERAFAVAKTAAVAAFVFQAFVALYLAAHSTVLLIIVGVLVAMLVVSKMADAAN